MMRKGARMQALNERDVSIDYAFMVTVEKFMRHGCENVPDYMLSGSRGDFTGVGDVHFFYSADEVLYGALPDLRKPVNGQMSPIRCLPARRWCIATVCCRSSRRQKRPLRKSWRFWRNETGNGCVMIETRRKNHGTQRGHSQRIPTDRRKQLYDGMITCTTLSGKAVCRLVWDMNKAECDAYLEKALSGVPDDFSGKLLEVPVGTGILTMSVYQTLPEADITCLDYSPDMMGQAQEKADRQHLKNVTFQQGDVGALPYADGTFNVVLSLNGFHAFPDKEAAYREAFRVLRPGGTFCGCFYVMGEHKRTDWFVRHVYEKTGFFYTAL